jgi:hypothetical protein
MRRLGFFVFWGILSKGVIGMFRSSRLIMALVMVFLAVVILNPDLGFSTGNVNPDAVAGKGGGKAPKYLGLQKTGQITSYYPGDDGALQKGVAWPEPRFTDNNNGTVTDNLTGLIWQKNANAFGYKSWNEALDYANNLQSGDYGLTDESKAGDWRLPNIRELLSLVDYGRYVPGVPVDHPFIELQGTYYWSSTTYASGPNNAWALYINYSYTNTYDKTDNGCCVWCVRNALK